MQVKFPSSTTVPPGVCISNILEKLLPEDVIVCVILPQNVVVPVPEIEVPLPFVQSP